MMNGSFSEICLHRTENRSTVEWTVLQIIARTCDLRNLLEGQEVAHLQSLGDLFAVVDRLTREIGWADDGEPIEANAARRSPGLS